MTSLLPSILKIKQFNLNQQVRWKNVKTRFILNKYWKEEDKPVPYFYTKQWRAKNKLPENPRNFGPLTNLPDYSFKDGRPVPYGMNQKRRMDLQRENLIRIKQLVGEVDQAVERYNQKQEQIRATNQQIIDSKLKEKGAKLLAPSNEAAKPAITSS